MAVPRALARGARGTGAGASLAAKTRRERGAGASLPGFGVSPKNLFSSLRPPQTARVGHLRSDRGRKF
jgi:hypothetical protein